MSSNLSLAKSFVRNQKLSLIKITQTVDIWRDEVRKTESTAPTGLIFRDSLLHISDQEFLNHKLFGDGSVPPLKINLYERGVRRFIEIPIVPLMTQHGFLSLVTSSRLSMEDPSENVFDLCSSELIQLLLDVEKTWDQLISTNLGVKTPYQSSSLIGDQEGSVKQTWHFLLSKILSAMGFPYLFRNDGLNLGLK